MVNIGIGDADGTIPSVGSSVGISESDDNVGEDVMICIGGLAREGARVPCAPFGRTDGLVVGVVSSVADCGNQFLARDVSMVGVPAVEERVFHGLEMNI